MKSLLTLTEYNLRAIKKPLIWMLLLMGPAELALTAAALFIRKGPLYAQPSIFYQDGMFITALCMIGAAVMNFAAVNRQSGRSKGIYTLMTLPMQRKNIYWSAVLSGVIAVWLVIAAQALWYIILYAPMCWMSDAYANHVLTQLVAANRFPQMPGYTAFMNNGLYLNIMRSGVLRFLMPTSLLGLCYLGLVVVCPTCCLQAILCRRGGAKALHIGLFCYSVVTTLIAIAAGAQSNPGLYDGYNGTQLALIMAHQLVLTLAVSLSACYGLKHSKNL